jgi:hypothetical protein
MTSDKCPVCNSTLRIECKPSSIAGVAPTYAVRCPNRAQLHEMATQITGTGMSAIEALDAFQARYARCLAWAAGRERQRAGEALVMTKPTRVILKAKDVDESSLPECPVCKVRLVWRRKALGGRSVFIVRCKMNMSEQDPCNLGRGCTQHDTLDGAVELWDRRRKRIEKEQAVFSATKCPRCGLRGEHVCVGDIHHYVRSGLPAGGFINMR